MKKNKSIFLQKAKDTALAVLPVYLIVLLVGIFAIPMSGNDIVKFSLASLLLMVGLLLFSTGAESSMLIMGEGIGGALSKSRRIVLFVVTSFIIGFFITIAEPDLTVFATQVASANKWMFIVTISAGFAFFMAVAVFRIIFQVKIGYILLASYGLVLILALIIPDNFVAVAFDSGSVTSGPVSTPFILAFGLGVSAVRSSKNSQESSFGLVGIASVGSIIMVTMLSFFASADTISAGAISTTLTDFTYQEMFLDFLSHILIFLSDVGAIIFAIFLVFLLFNTTMLHFPKTKILKIVVGLILTYLGIVIYLTGVTTGFLPIASVLGYSLMTKGGVTVILPILLLIGFSIVFAEPAIHVLINKVYELTSGQISKKTMQISFAISMSISIILASLRMVYGIEYLMILIPLYLTILLLLFFTPQIFIAIAFDSGGVITGPMTSSFMLPLVSGIAIAAGSGATEGSIGTIALIASMPLLMLQIIGVVFRIKQYKMLSQQKVSKRKRKIEIINFGV